MITGIPRINSIENICSNFKRHLYIVIYNKKWVNAKKQHLVLVSTAIKHVYEIMGDEKSNRVHPKIRKNLHISYDNGRYNNTLSDILYKEYDEEKVKLSNLLQTRETP